MIDDGDRERSAQDREREELEAAFRSALASDDGKRVLFWLLEQAGVYRDPFSGDDATTNYVLGQQSIGRRLIGQLEAIDPRAYPRLLLEVADMKAMALAADEQKDADDDHMA